MKRGFMFAAIVGFAALLGSCGGGGGGGNSIGNAAPLFNMTGGWSGSYQLPSGTVSIVGTLTANGNSYSGSFTTSNGATLNVSGQVSGTQATLHISSTMGGSCNGSFDGTGTLSQPGAQDTLTFSYSGSDCNGSLAGIPGSIHRTSGSLTGATPVYAQFITTNDDGGTTSQTFDAAEMDAALWIVESKLAIKTDPAQPTSIDLSSMKVDATSPIRIAMPTAFVLVDDANPSARWIIVPR